MSSLLQKLKHRLGTTEKRESGSTLSWRSQKIARFYKQGASTKRVGFFQQRWLRWGVMLLAGVSGNAFAGSFTFKPNTSANGYCNTGSRDQINGPGHFYVEAIASGDYCQVDANKDAASHEGYPYNRLHFWCANQSEYLSSVTLTNSGRLDFQLTSDFNGTMTDAFTFRAWLPRRGLVGDKVPPSTNAPTTAFRSATDTTNIIGSAVNHAPVLIPCVIKMMPVNHAPVLFPCMIKSAGHH